MRFSIVFFMLVLCFSFTTDKIPAKCYKSFQEWYKLHHAEMLIAAKGTSLSYELRYLPNEVAICEQIAGKPVVTQKEIRSLYATYGNYDEYSFKIISPTESNLLFTYSLAKSDFQDKQFYLIESIQQDFIFVNGIDTLKPVRCHFENNYGTTPFLTFHLVFEKSSHPAGTIQVVYTDHLFDSDIVRFDISHLANLRIPKIK